MRTKPILAVLIALFCTIILFSCGYTLQGGAKLSGDIKSISVPVFKNKSSQVGAEIIFTNILIEEFMKSSAVKIINPEEQPNLEAENSILQKNGLHNNSNADAVIIGTIVSISFDALARTSKDIVYNRGLNAVVTVEMKSKNGDILFSLRNFTESESYFVTHENLVDEKAVQSTLKIVADRFARRVVSQMCDNF